MPKVRGKSRDPVRTRAALMLAARDEFVANGLTGARTSAIAKGADVPQGLIYHYFENKADLFSAVMNESLEPYFVSTIEMLEGATGDSLELLERAIRMHFEFLAEHPHIARLMAWWQADQGWQNGPILPCDKASLCERPFELGAQRIKEGQAAGLIRSDLDPQLVMTSFLGLSMDWHVNEGMHCAEHGIDRTDETAVLGLRQRALDHIVELTLLGVATAKGREEKLEYSK